MNVCVRIRKETKYNRLTEENEKKYRIYIKTSNNQTYNNKKNKKKKKKINTSSKCSYCFDELGHNKSMLFLVSCESRCHYHHKRLNLLLDYSIHIQEEEEKNRKMEDEKAAAQHHSRHSSRGNNTITNEHHHHQQQQKLYD